MRFLQLLAAEVDFLLVLVTLGTETVIVTVIVTVIATGNGNGMRGEDLNPTEVETTIDQTGLGATVILGLPTEVAHRQEKVDYIQPEIDPHHQFALGGTLANLFQPPSVALPTQHHPTMLRQPGVV